MSFFLPALATIVTVVDPVGIAPLFIALAGGATARQRLSIMRRAVIIAAIILLLFAALGRALLSALGITVPAFSIAGGILLLLVAIDMLFARVSRSKETPEEEQAAQTSTDISVFPLAIPIISGPGSIVTVILYMQQAQGNVAHIIMVLGAIAIALIATYLSMRLSSLLLASLGPTGVNVVGRIMGIVLAALAIQFVLNGIGQYWHSLAR